MQIQIQTMLWMMGWVAAGMGIGGFVVFVAAKEQNEMSGVVGGLLTMLLGFLMIVGLTLLGTS